MFAKRNKLSIALVALTLVLALAGFAAAKTPAGTKISNQATATYKAGDVERVSASNVVYVTVQQVAGVAVGPADAITRTVVAGQVVQHVYTVKNTGNGPDTFTLNAILGTPGLITNTNLVKWYHDVNGNGVINSGEPTVTEIALAVGEEANIIAQFTVPSDATADGTVTLQLEATSSIAPASVVKSGIVTYTVADEGVVTAVLSRDKAEVGPGEEITYTVRIANPMTTNPVSNVSVELDVPGNTTFLKDSLHVLGVKQDDPEHFPETVTGLSVTAGQTVEVSYKVKVKADAKVGHITNTVAVSVNGTAVPTNEVRTLVRMTAGVKLERDTSSDGFDVAPAKIGHEYTFTYTVTNDGNGDDVIYIGASGLPSGWPVRLYRSDGTTPLPSQDGKYTVGELEPGESADIVVKVLVPVDVENGSGPYNLDVTATSKSDPSKHAKKQVTFNNVEGAGVTVTVGSEPVEGKDVPNPGAVVEYPVTIKNDGPTDDTFDLIFEPDTDPDKYPPGTTAEFVDKDGNPITEVAVKPGQKVEVYIRITIPDDAEPGQDIDGKVLVKSQNRPTVNNEDDERDVKITVNELVSFTVAPDRVAAVNQGSYAVYEFTITNEGNKGATFDVGIKEPSNSRLTYQLLDLSAGNSLQIAKGKSKSFRVRIDADYTANVGWTESVQVTATTGDEPNQVTRSASLTTTVIGSELTMTKTADVTEQDPGKNIVYTIEVENVSTGPLKDVVIYDAIPQHTVFDAQAVTAGVVSKAQYSTDGGSTWVDGEPTKADVTNVRWNVGDLAVGETVTVTLTVEVK